MKYKGYEIIKDENSGLFTVVEFGNSITFETEGCVKSYISKIVEHREREGEVVTE